MEKSTKILLGAGVVGAIAFWATRKAGAAEKENPCAPFLITQDEIRCMQGQLYANGYFGEPASSGNVLRYQTGLLSDPATVAALKNFQQTVGLAVTGNYGSAERKYFAPLCIETCEEPGMDFPVFVGPASNG